MSIKANFIRRTAAAAAAALTLVSFAGCSKPKIYGTVKNTAIYEKYVDNIAVGVENLIMLFQPEVIVFGGAISNEGENLLRPLRSRVSSGVRLVCSELKNDAGFIGAAAQLAEE